MPGAEPTGGLDGRAILDRWVGHVAHLMRLPHREGLQASLGPASEAFSHEVGRFWTEMKVVGDPHLPGPMMAAVLSRGLERRVWKPCAQRFRAEAAFQDMVRALGDCGLRAVGVEPAWGGVIAEFIEDQPRTAESFDRRCRAVAHLLLLIGCFGLADMNHENILFDGNDLAVIDAETFGITGAHDGNALDALTQIGPKVVQRLGCAMNFGLLSAEGEAEVVASRVLDFLDEAAARLQSVWAELVRIRRDLAGAPARQILRGSTSYAQMMSFAMDDDWSARVVEELERLPHTQAEGPASVVEALRQGAIPRFDTIIPSDGWVEPGEVVEVLRTYLVSGLMQPRVSLGTGLGEVNLLGAWLGCARLASKEGSGFIIGEADPLKMAWLSSSDGAVGLIGASLLGWGRRVCGMEEGLGGIAVEEVDQAILDGLSWQDRQEIGVFKGVAGAFLYACARRRMGVPFQDLESRLRHQVVESPDFPLSHPRDAAIGVPGLVLGLARLQGVLPCHSLLQKALPLMASEAMEAVEALQSGHPWSQLGCVHGLAGLHLAIHEASTVLGVVSPVYRAVEDQLVGLLEPHHHLDREMDVCRGRGGVLGVLARTCPDRVRGRSVAVHHRGPGLCHGDAAVAAALGWWPETMKEDMTDLAPAGLFTGVAGAAYARLAWAKGLPNPLWGGLMGDALPVSAYLAS